MTLFFPLDAAPPRRRKKNPSGTLKTFEIVRGRFGFGFTLSGRFFHLQVGQIRQICYRIIKLFFSNFLLYAQYSTLHTHRSEVSIGEIKLFSSQFCGSGSGRICILFLDPTFFHKILFNFMQFNTSKWCSPLFITYIQYFS